MSLLINLILVLAFITLLCHLTVGGLKGIVKNGRDNLKNIFKKSEGVLLNEDPHSTIMSGQMSVVNLTTGTCARCGENFVGTSADTSCPIMKVTFMGVTKIMCKSCHQQLLAEFEKAEKSGKVTFSDSANKLTKLFK